MQKSSRKLFTYYFQDIPIFSLGYVHYIKANSPLPIHDHGEMLEFVYMERGSQRYQTSDGSFTVHPGEVFFTRPNEPHGTGASPEEISTLYYLIVDLKVLQKIDLFRFPEEYGLVHRFADTFSHRIYSPAPHLPAALKQLLRCFEIQGPHFDTRVRNALSEVVLALISPQPAAEARSSVSIARSLQYIHSHPEEPIRVSQLPAMDNLSLSAYSKHFGKTLGISPGEYILKYKIECSKKLLEETDLSVTEIAYRFGFSSSQYFATVFRRFCSTTPSHYRKQSRQQGQHV